MVTPIITTSAQFSLPSIKAFIFLPFLLLQVILLHPYFNCTKLVNRISRILLGIISSYLAIKACYTYRIEPIESSIGANFRYGILGPYVVMKAIEWGLAKHRSPYTWIGFDREITSDGKGHFVFTTNSAASEEVDNVSSQRIGGLESNLKRRLPIIKTHLPSPSPSPSTSPSPSPPLDLSSATILEASTGIPLSTSVDLLKISPSLQPVQTYSTLQILSDSIHLLTSMRGLGYAFGPTSDTLALSPVKGDYVAFFKQAVKEVIKSHILSTMSVIITIEQYNLVPFLLHRYILPFLSPTGTVIQQLSNVLSYTAVGISLYAQMNLGFQGFSLLYFFSHLLLRLLPFPSLHPKEFETREWTPLFNSPFGFENLSVTTFWSSKWHGMFRQAFLAAGFNPTVEILKRVIGKGAARIIGVFVVFGLSAWMHSHALWSARYLLPSPSSPLSLSIIQGGNFYFLSQALAVILESIFTRYTNRKITEMGLIGRIWTFSIVVGLGLVAGRSWVGLGLVRGLPGVESWSWERFLLPTVALAPSPVFTR